MEIIWFGILAVLLAGYFALEGFDIGVGLLLPFTGDRDKAVGAIGPFVLANEVWLVALGGVLLGAFPLLEGEVLSAHYGVVVALLLSWIVRDAGLWFRRRLDGPGWRAFWTGAITVGSLGLALSWGGVLAGIIGGPALLGLAYGVVVAVAFAFHGWTFLAWRLPGDAVAQGARRGGAALGVSAVVAMAPALVPLGVLAGDVVDRAAPSATLSVLSLIVLPFVPVLAGAQVWVWRSFGKGAVPTFF
ncbi:cytochrome d ubiquinol oxidase subunit II [Acrocarpospora catenulata]|uniref:cytochrome d ubiquinol oxidase subunit II n=1 Tax=Acrocarpospora catenulata TaxID=2836182 RepID=UPI001BD94B6B|nr:cytochrome d ubiquinol oxidase subunit II [Acrocarpospora catenulata]